MAVHLLLLATLSSLYPTTSTSPGSPILLVPGLTGSQLEVMDTDPLCTTFGEFLGLWIDPYRFVELSCIQRELELTYDAESNLYGSHPGVTTKVPGFGETTSVQFINTDSLIHVPYMNEMVKYFVERGYKDGHNIQAAPYDWRLAADNLEMQGYFEKLKALLEELYEQNGRQKVIIISHSMGAPTILHFLTGYQSVSQEWKDKHIKAWVTLSGAWSGGNSAIQELISGPSHLPSTFMFARYFADKILTPIIRTLASTFWLLPREIVWGDKTLVSTPSRNYTAKDYQQLFEDIGHKDALHMLNGVLKINPNFPAPNVPMHCFYGIGVKTVDSMIYDEDLQPGVIPESAPKLIWGNGDGTVNIESSEICLKWKSMPSQYPFESRTFSNVHHANMVSNATVLIAVGEIVGASAHPTSNLPPPPSSERNYGVWIAVLVVIVASIWCFCR